MTDYKEIPLGEEAIKYIKEILTDGKTLSHLVLEEIKFQRGKITTYLPEYITKEDAYKFSEGKIKVNEKEIIKISHNKIVNAVETDENKDVIRIAKSIAQQENSSELRITPVPNTDFWLSSYIQKFISDGEHICVFENELAESADPWLLKRKSQVIYYTNEVYHFLNSHNLSKNNIESTIRESKAAYPPLVGLISKFNKDTLHNGDTISLDILKSFIEKTEKIIIGAYDGEGYLLWEKD